MSLSLRQKLGQLIIAGFHGKDAKDSWVQTFAEHLTKGEAGGLILFSYNVESPEQLTNLTDFFHGLSTPHKLFISVDQEGGRVQRLKPDQGFPAAPSAATVAQGSLEDARGVYDAMARILTAHGINVDFAPCVDVNPEGPKCPVIGELQRSYSSLPAKVTDYGRAMIEAFRDRGLMSVIKHFPGHGSAQADSHAGFVDVTAHWDERELIPFYALTKENGADMVMTAHIFNEKFDAEMPATLSKPTLDHLRKNGYDGVIISDDLHMGAIQSHYDVSDATVKALNAGCDMLILSNNKAAAQGVEGFEPSPDLLPALLDDLERAVATGDLPEARVDEAYGRVVALKNKYL